MFVLFYNNGLKAIFKTTRRAYKLHFIDSLYVYKFSKLLDLKIIPPTVLRKVEKEIGLVSLFIENNHQKTEEMEKIISSHEKTNIYIFAFLMGFFDPGINNILISEKCSKPVLIDHDGKDHPGNFQMSLINGIFYRRNVILD